MNKIIFSTYGHSPALVHARNCLESWGYTVTPDPADATHLLLPVPTFDENGNVKGTGKLSDIMPRLSDGVTLLGGNLDFVQGKTRDLLKDEYYLIENAAITAQCALKLVQHRCLKGAAVLIIGWGRIGKQLAKLLHAAGTRVTVATRSPDHLQAVTDWGFDAVYLSELQPEQYSIIFNTAPAPVLHQNDTAEDALLIDLASVKGIAGDRVLWARSLPGKDAPQSSGNLIAKTALRYALGKE